MFTGVLGVLAFIVWVYCIIDVVTTPREHVRTLPKLVWLIVVILLFDIGSIAWLIFGHAWSQPGPGARLGVGGRGERPRGGSGVRAPARAPTRPSNPDDDEEFLASLSARAEEQRRRAREADPAPGDEPPSTPGPTA